MSAVQFILTDIEGTTLDAFTDQRSAVLAAIAMMDQLAVSPDELLLMAYDNNGSGVGEAVCGNEILARKLRWEITTDTVRPSEVELSEPHFAANVAAVASCEITAVHG